MVQEGRKHVCVCARAHVRARSWAVEEGGREVGVTGAW